MAILGRIAAVGLAVLALGLSPGAASWADGNALEYAVKANDLYKFAPFVDWPQRVFATPASPLTICIAGEDPFGRILDDSVKDQKLGAHPIVVRRLASVAPGLDCHILFVGRSTAQTTADVLRVVAGQPVLTVTDQSRGISGGMIQFVLRDGRVRFDIDAAGAEAAGVPISSKLLGLAVTVRKAPK